MGSDADDDDVIGLTGGRELEFLRRLSEQGWKVASLDGGISCDSFFEAVRALPADPAMGPFPNWDGFADSLFGGLVLLDHTSLAIVWRDAELMRQSDPAVFKTAISVFRQVIENLRNERRQGRSTARVRVCVVGVRDLPPST
jgi:hypothetical protein